MHDKLDNRSGPWSVRSLERRLRNAPQPPVPANLEKKILAAIPLENLAAAAPRPSRAIRWALAGSVAAAAAVLIVIFTPSSSRPSPVELRPVAVAAGHVSEDDIRRAIERRAIAAMHLASAEMLDSVADGQEYAAAIRKHVMNTYADVHVTAAPAHSQRSRP